MVIAIAFHTRQKLLIVEAPLIDRKKPPEVISMAATSGDWLYEDAKIKALSLPAGKWLITDDPRRSAAGITLGCLFVTERQMINFCTAECGGTESDLGFTMPAAATAVS